MSHVPDCSFVICVEKGSLEYKALLLILTLRRNWGPWAKLPIYAYSPRKDRQPSDWLKAIYQAYDVTPIYENLNVDFSDYALANKPYAMAHAERNLKSNTLVFLDTDILCWHPPSNFNLGHDIELSLCVDTTKTFASYGPGDSHEAMWNQLYHLGEVTHEPPYVVTHLTRERVRSWWMSSVIPCKREAGLMNEWLKLFRKVAREDIFSPDAGYMREQIVLCVVATRVREKFKELPITHCYPVQNYDYYTRMGFSPEAAALWHYQPFLNRFLRKFAVRIDATPDISGKIVVAERAIEQLRVHYRSMLGLDESFARGWRRRLGVGPRIRRVLGVKKSTDDRARGW
jgi:hypothetical protein